MDPQHKSRRAGFTLVEILVVLGIVAVLAAIVFTAFARVREKGRSATCQSNLKQIALAMQQYVQANDGRFPALISVLNGNGPVSNAIHWHNAIMPYLKSNAVLWCPTSESRETNLPDYVYNRRQLNDVLPRQGSGPNRNRFVGSHESKPLLASTVALNFDQCWKYGDGFIANGSEIETSCGTRIVGTLHSSGANYSFIDGHVKWLSAARQGELVCEMWQNSNP